MVANNESGAAMNLKACATSVALLALTASVSGCAATPPPGVMRYGHCGRDAHTESYPYAKLDRRAYGCKSDDNGFLEGAGQGDPRRN
jgi:hypothetical protein